MKVAGKVLVKVADTWLSGGKDDVYKFVSDVLSSLKSDEKKKVIRFFIQMMKELH